MMASMNDAPEGVPTPVEGMTPDDIRRECAEYDTVVSSTSATPELLNGCALRLERVIAANPAAYGELQQQLREEHERSIRLAQPTVYFALGDATGTQG